MSNPDLYLPTAIPQWGIFLGIVLLTIGFVDKNRRLTLIGWITLVCTGIAALYFNLLGTLSNVTVTSADTALDLLISTGWQSAAGGALSLFSLVFFYYEKKRYKLLSFLTIAYFVLVFFLYAQVSALAGKDINKDSKTEQKETK
ncbi:MAG: hypothetical protein NTV75_01675 [Bacteroidia bacterium]|nr:hypothetical protein [Bacteroidia bacterium]